MVNEHTNIIEVLDHAIPQDEVSRRICYYFRTDQRLSYLGIKKKGEGYCDIKNLSDQTNGQVTLNNTRLDSTYLDPPSEKMSKRLNELLENCFDISVVKTALNGIAPRHYAYCIFTRKNPKE